MDLQSRTRIEPATEHDVPFILRMTRALAAYEKVLHEVTATEATLRETLFGRRPYAQAAVAYADDEPAGMAVFFHTYSTFLGRPGLYLEDIIVEERWRGRGLGMAPYAYVARLAVERGCATVSNGRSSIGMGRRSDSIARRRTTAWTTGPCTG